MHTVLSCVVIDNVERSTEISASLRKLLYLKIVGVFDERALAEATIVEQKPDIIIVNADFIANSAFDFPKMDFYNPDILVIGGDEKESKKWFQGMKVFYMSKDFLNKEGFSVFEQLLNNHIKLSAMRNISSNKSMHHIFVKSDGMFLRLAFDDIEYVKAYGEYVKIHNNGRWSLANCTMKSLEEKLPQRLFCRVHKSYIVRLDRINSFDSTHLQLSDTVIPIGRGHKAQFESAITKIS